ncbi:hypothetical protein JB92DRAFT_2952455 [Gautieria morchelliformis]|nr:hypothetical protein JB92DRAFT_2952455 [Gautieria morchelliformis]
MVPAEPPVRYQHSLTSGSIIIGIPLLLWSSLGLNRPFYSVWTIYKCIKIWRGACFCLPFVFLTPRVSRSRLMSWLSGDL